MSAAPGIPSRKILSVGNTLDAIGLLSEEITGFFSAHAASPAATSAVNLAVEELVTNVVSYGFPAGGDEEIRVELAIDAAGLTAVVDDGGSAYNPLEQAPPDTEATLEARPVGGLGIHLVRQLMDDVQYVRRDGRNIVTVRKDVER